MALSIKDLLGQSEFWIFLFALGWVLLNWPMLSLAIGNTILGVPAILIYIPAVWMMLILILYLFERGQSD